MCRVVDNETAFPAQAFLQFSPDGRETVVLAVRGVFELRDGRLEESAEQPEFRWIDQYAGDPSDGALVRQADFIAFKPATDVTVHGFTFAPGAEPIATWTFGLRVLDAGRAVRARKLIRANGPRYWEPVAVGEPSKGWRLGASRPVASLPLRWDYAAGGLQHGTDGAEPSHDPSNPIGFGAPGLRDPEARTPQPAPLFEDPDQPLVAPDVPSVPQNLAPIPPAWRSRQRHAGTYDDAWRETRWPLLPEDFDYRFYNCAHADLAIAPHLSGNEELELLNLTPGGGIVRFALPGLSLAAAEEDGDGQPVHLRLDGVHLHTTPRGVQIELTWRGAWADTGRDIVRLWANTLGDRAARAEAAA